MNPPISRNDYKIAIICALPVEAAAVGALFDDTPGQSSETPTHGKAAGDTNAYMTGRIAQHHVILAFMPEMGKAAAAGVAASLRSSYPQLKLAVVLGVCGGVPKTPSGQEIFLGDVVVSSGIIQYDFGRLYPAGFIRKESLTHSLHRPGVEIRAVIAKLKAQQLSGSLQSQIAVHLEALRRDPRSRAFAAYPGAAEDRLFDAGYPHGHGRVGGCAICSSASGEICSAAQRSSCEELDCDERALVGRQRRSGENDTEQPQQPMVHFGLVASGDTLMRSGLNRDMIASKEKVIAFEMEGAGAWDILPCVLIKGISDYADSHKNKKWQGYASTTAAACLKAFLGQWTLDAQPSSLEGEESRPGGGSGPSSDGIWIGASTQSSVVAATLTNDGGINLRNRRDSPRANENDPSVPRTAPMGRSKSSHAVEIEKDVTGSVVANTLTNRGGINL
ncbi:nucleoside phosphorylase domain-containing protein [Aspergillus aurantiobrunneus]